LIDLCVNDAKGLIWPVEQLKLLPSEIEEHKEQTNKSNSVMKMRVNVAPLLKAQTEQNQKRRLEARQIVVDTRKTNDQQRQKLHRSFTTNSFLFVQLWAPY